MGFELDPSYKDVPARIADFKAKHPDGCLRPANPAEPYRIEAIDGRFFVVYTAAAYRSPDDAVPGIGIAWEPFPGKTPYTRDSELQNAETSAWGRAIVAALASESKAVASAEDIRNRKADAAEERSDPELDKQRAELAKRATHLAATHPDKVEELREWVKEQGLPEKPMRLTRDQAVLVAEWFERLDQADTEKADPEAEQPELPEVDGKKAKAAANEAYETLHPKKEAAE